MALIYPYWNVNLATFGVTGGTEPALIYPYWNVNITASADYTAEGTGLNLSILECKFKLCK